MRRGLTIRELAEKCAEQGTPVSYSGLAYLDRGEYVPRPALRAALARILDLDPVGDFERKAS